jgi:hypothetical protein
MRLDQFVGSSTAKFERDTDEISADLHIPLEPSRQLRNLFQAFSEIICFSHHHIAENTILPGHNFILA